jgi:hypothetical protein
MYGALKALICSHSIVGITALNPAEGMGVGLQYLLCFAQVAVCVMTRSRVHRSV